MTTKKPVFIFDFGGVLVDWNPYRVYLKYFGGDKQAVDQFFEEIDFFGWNYEQDKGRSFAEGVAVLSGRFPHHAGLIRAYDVEWEQSVGEVNAHTVHILEELKRQGYTLLGLTNWSAEKFPLVRNKLSFMGLLDYIVISGEVGLAKPDPQIFDHVLGYAGCPASECIFIDDSLANIETARKKGMQVVHFQSAEQLSAEMEKAGFLV